MNPGIGASTEELPRSELLQALEHVLESPQFRASKKCSRFLRHIVESALDHRFDCLKERSLGIEVFEREPNYDTNQDPIVRSAAGEVRKRLAQYYQEDGRNDIYRFSLHAGSYIPEVSRVKPAEVVESAATAAAPAAAEPEKIAASPRRLLLPIAGVAAVVILVALSLRFSARPATEMDEFWKPLIDAKKSPVVSMGQPQLFTVRGQNADAISAWFSTPHPTSPPPVPAVPISDLVSMQSDAASLSDSRALLRVANLFAAKGRPLELRGERSVSLSDLRGRPVILIGAFDNTWTINLTGELRYYFDSVPHEQFIRDRQSAAPSKWRISEPWPPTDKIHTDYALVTRVVNPTTESIVVSVAGITQYGTQAAAEFVTTPEYLARALKDAPRDWSGKNFQAVLETTVVSGTGGPPKVLAVHFW